VQALLRHRDREFAISHLWQVTGFRQQAVALTKLSLSPSTYTLKHRLELAIREITTTSSRLLYLIFYTGLLIFGLSIAVILYFLGRYFTTGIGVNGFTSIIVSIWFLGGLTTLILGVLGIYVANILAETKRRPYTIVRRVYRGETPPAFVTAPDKTIDR
jgi:putative glycosyltransferase